MNSIRCMLVGLSLSVFFSLGANAQWRPLNVPPSTCCAIQRANWTIAEVEGTTRDYPQRPLLTVSCDTEGKTRADIKWTPFITLDRQTPVSWRVDDGAANHGIWQVCLERECASLDGPDAISFAKTLVGAKRLQVTIDRGENSPIDIALVIDDPKEALKAVGVKCGWLK